MTSPDTLRHGSDTPLAPLPRFGLVASTSVLLALAQPGLLRPDGFGHLAFFALGPWAYAASRPGRRAFLAEWLAHALGLLAWFLWMRHLLPWLLAPMALVPSLYLALGGVLLRRLARRYPLGFAAPVAFGAAELVRWHLPPPFSFGWLRTGELLHDTLWLSGSARVWGSHGLTFVLGALGGLAAEVAFAARRAGPRQFPSGLAFLCGVGPLVLGVSLALFVPAPATRGAVGVVIAQPGIEQRLKGGRGDYVADEYVPLVDEALAGIAAARAAGRPDPELVLFGETILLGGVVPEAVLAAHDAGLRPPEWSGRAGLTRHELEERDTVLRVLVGALFGDPAVVGAGGALARSARALVGRAVTPWAARALAGERLFPPGTQLLSGVEAYDVIDGELRRRNAVGLWDASGARIGLGSKVELVPAAEGLDPVKHLPFAVAAVRRLGGYVPDFVAGSRTTVLEARRADGAPLRIGATVCYDNAFDHPYTAPLRAEPVDWFVIASNEAWYRRSCAMDHLLAMARMRAIATGRAVVRATNSGISAVLGPDGRAVALLAVDGQRKMVRGHLFADVPLPADPASWTPYVATARWQPFAWAALALGALLVAGRPRRARGAGR